MNQQMILAGLRLAVQWLCSSLVTWGFLTAEDVPAALKQADVLLPALVALALFVWQVRQKRNAARVAAAASVPGVSVIRTTDQALANAVPDPKVVGPGGT